MPSRRSAAPFADRIRPRESIVQIASAAVSMIARASASLSRRRTVMSARWSIWARTACPRRPGRSAASERTRSSPLLIRRTCCSNAREHARHGVERGGDGAHVGRAAELERLRVDHAAAELERLGRESTQGSDGAGDGEDQQPDARHRQHDEDARPGAHLVVGGVRDPFGLDLGSVEVLIGERADGLQTGERRRRGPWRSVRMQRSGSVNSMLVPLGCRCGRTDREHLDERRAEREVLVDRCHHLVPLRRLVALHAGGVVVDHEVRRTGGEERVLDVERSGPTRRAPATCTWCRWRRPRPG